MPKGVYKHKRSAPIYSSKRDTNKIVSYLLNRVEQVTESGCWIWTGALNSWGYGNMAYRTPKGKIKYIGTHRMSYLAHKGTIPKGMTIDHLCRVVSCINPYHLECVTNLENNYRSDNISARNKRKTHCHKGHPLEGENLYLYKPKGKQARRDCRQCRRITDSKRKPRVRSALDRQT